jgi:hypothetical protein
MMAYSDNAQDLSEDIAGDTSGSASTLGKHCNAKLALHFSLNLFFFMLS